MIQHKQSTPTLLMIRPVKFGFNEQTAGSNAFQNKLDTSGEELQAKALAEFDAFVLILKSNGINVLVIDDTPLPHTPDSIFPNNWISFHDNGDIVLYPMQAQNRRVERREDIIHTVEESFEVKQVVDLSHFESFDQFLEGTGSLVLDRINNIAYACLSPRTDLQVVKVFSEKESYKILSFNAIDQRKQLIYHTNVLMCIGSGFVVICLDSVAKETEKEALLQSFKDTGKELVNISFEQMNSFAGNMLEVENINGEKLLVMSKQAYRSLNISQIQILEHHTKIIYADISTIETIGGGSARCMLAEVHLPIRK